MSGVNHRQSFAPSRPSSRMNDHDDITAAAAASTQLPPTAGGSVVVHTPLATSTTKSLKISNFNKKRRSIAQLTSPEAPSTTIARNPTSPERLRSTIRPSGAIRGAKEMSPPPAGSTKAWNMRSTSMAAPNATRMASPFTSNGLLGDMHGNDADHGMSLGLDTMNSNRIDPGSLDMGMVADSDRYSPDLVEVHPGAYMHASGVEGHDSMGKRSRTTLDEQMDYVYSAPAKRHRTGEPTLARSLFLDESVR
jgi:hypothetical protein